VLDAEHKLGYKQLLSNTFQSLGFPMWHLRIAAFILTLSFLYAPKSLCAMDDWQPVTPEELNLKYDAAHPYPAVILYHEETSDDNRRHTISYYRLKVLTEAGRDRASVVIPYRDDFTHIIDVKGRTISPDGAITAFEGKAFDTTVVKGKGLKVKAKTFALPNVQVGSIIEYRYTEYWDYWLLAPHWILQEELPQLRAKFTFIPYHGSNGITNEEGDFANRVYSYVSADVPKEAVIKRTPQDNLEMEVTNLPAFQEEDLAPPSDLLKMRVDFYYGGVNLDKPANFWRSSGKSWNRQVEKFIGNSGEVAAAARALVTPADTPDQIARKIYARIQKMKNLSYAREYIPPTSKDKKEDTAEDILRKESGYSQDLTRLFVAMARSMGVKAYAMRIARRDRTFFQIQVPNWGQLAAEIAVVSLPDGKEIFLDPGTPFAPFGMLDWRHSLSEGVRQMPDGSTTMAKTPAANYTNAITQRVARLTLSSDGAVTGKIRLVWIGQEGLTRRLSASQTDDAGRKKEFEDELKRLLPAGAMVTTESISGLENTDENLSVLFKVELPGFASVVGKRLLFPTGLFQANSKTLFVSQQRKFPVYLSYPYRAIDDLQITIPSDYTLEAMPQIAPLQTEFSIYKCQRSVKGGTVTLTRDFAIAGVGFPLKDYPDLRKFFAGVADGDGQQVALTMAK
jgi:transglutaminase-like putative cysteine protease